MRPLSVAERQGKRNASTRQQQPREGSKIRQVYDRLVANKGRAVSIHGIYKDTVTTQTALDQLRLFYGMDIRMLVRGFHAKPYPDSNGRQRVVQRDSLYVLVGEWDGRAYIDYVAERLKDG